MLRADLTLVLGRLDPSGRPFHVALCADRNYLRPAGVTAASLIRENPGMDLVVHLLCDEFPEAQRDRFLRLVAGRRAQVRVHRMEPGTFDQLPLAMGYPKAIYYRLLAPDLAGAETDRLLYLDGDILCMGSLAPLAELDLSRHTAAAVPDLEVTARARIGPLGLRGGRYFNSGVLLMNLPRWIERRVSQRVLEAVARLALVLPDQDGLNVVLDGEVLFLDGRWNSMVPGKEPAVLRHFADFQKPWKEAYDPQQADAYRRVYRESPWGDVPLDPPGRRSEKKFMSRRCLGEGRFLEAAGWYLRYAFTPRR